MREGNNYIKFLLKKYTSVPEYIEREEEDDNKNDIDNSSLDNLINNLPDPNFPKPKKGDIKK